MSLDDVIEDRLLGIGNSFNINGQTILPADNIEFNLSDKIQAAE